MSASRRAASRSVLEVPAALSNAGGDDTVNDELAVTVHGRVAGPREKIRALTKPLQAKQNAECANYQFQDFHTMPLVIVSQLGCPLGPVVPIDILFRLPFCCQTGAA